MANTANEIMKRFKDNNFHPISITIRSNNETLELTAEKIDESQMCHAGNLSITVSKNSYPIAIGGIEPVASYLRAYGTDKTDTFTGYTSETAKDAAEIARDVLIDFDSFEPTDTQGMNLEGTALYKNEPYGVYLSAYCNKPYIMQAAEDIAEQL